MISIVADTLKTEFDRVLVAGGDKQKLNERGLVCYPDPVADRGALGGIYTGLLYSDSPWFFCCGCDMPLLKQPVVGRIIDNIADEDVLMPVVNNVRQPLHAVYKKRILPAVKELMSQKKKYLPDLFEGVRVRYLDEGVVADIPDYQLSFVNFNSADMVSQYRSYLVNL